MEERRQATYFAMQHEMKREEYKERRVGERAWKHEKARYAKEAYARGGEKMLMKAKVAMSYSGLMDYFISIVSMCCIKLVMHFI
jgi:hypothetical protein